MSEHRRTSTQREYPMHHEYAANAYRDPLIIVPCDVLDGGSFIKYWDEVASSIQELFDF